MRSRQRGQPVTPGLQNEMQWRVVCQVKKYRAANGRAATCFGSRLARYLARGKGTVTETIAQSRNEAAIANTIVCFGRFNFSPQATPIRYAQHGRARSWWQCIERAHELFDTLGSMHGSRLRDKLLAVALGEK